jgi:hypothetical protein
VAELADAPDLGTNSALFQITQAIEFASTYQTWPGWSHAVLLGAVGSCWAEFGQNFCYRFFRAFAFFRRTFPDAFPLCPFCILSAIAMFQQPF